LGKRPPAISRYRQLSEFRQLTWPDCQGQHGWPRRSATSVTFPASRGMDARPLRSPRWCRSFRRVSANPSDRL